MFIENTIILRHQIHPQWGVDFDDLHINKKDKLYILQNYLMEFLRSLYK